MNYKTEGQQKNRYQADSKNIQSEGKANVFALTTLKIYKNPNKDHCSISKLSLYEFRFKI